MISFPRCLPLVSSSLSSLLFIYLLPLTLNFCRHSLSLHFLFLASFPSSCIRPSQNFSSHSFSFDLLSSFPLTFSHFPLSFFSPSLCIASAFPSLCIVYFLHSSLSSSISCSLYPPFFSFPSFHLSLASLLLFILSLPNYYPFPLLFFVSPLNFSFSHSKPSSLYLFVSMSLLLLPSLPLSLLPPLMSSSSFFSFSHSLTLFLSWALHFFSPCVFSSLLSFFPPFILSPSAPVIQASSLCLSVFLLLTSPSLFPSFFPSFIHSLLFPTLLSFKFLHFYSLCGPPPPCPLLPSLPFSLLFLSFPRPTFSPSPLYSIPSPLSFSSLLFSLSLPP